MTCVDPAEAFFFDVNLTSIRSKTFALSPVKHRVATVLVFLAEDCPICQRYASVLNQIDVDYRSKNVHVRGIFPGTVDNEASTRSFPARV